MGDNTLPTITATQAGGAAICTMLDLIAWSEGTSTSPISKANGYDVEVSSVNGPAVFEGFSFHPFESKPAAVVRLVPQLLSTAAGRYQLLLRYYLAYKQQLNLPDFSPLSQDLIAIQQIKEKHAVALLQANAVQEGIEALAPVWASLPGNNYGQGGHSMQVLLNKWQELSQHT